MRSIGRAPTTSHGSGHGCSASRPKPASLIPSAFAKQWHILMKGSIVAAGEGDRQAARRAQEIGALLLREHAEVSSPAPLRRGGDRGRG